MANEKRLIDASAFLNTLQNWYPIAIKNGDIGMIRTIEDVMEELSEQPTVDAVEVVRCKDCKHWLHMGDGMGDCTNARFHLPGHADPTMEVDGFCSCGERRTNDLP